MSLKKRKTIPITEKTLTTSFSSSQVPPRRRRIGNMGRNERPSMRPLSVFVFMHQAEENVSASLNHKVRKKWKILTHLKANIETTRARVGNPCNLLSLLLDIVEVACSHSGFNLATAFAKILEDFGISDKILSITCDNASNNDTMIEELAVLIDDFPGPANQTRCFLHILNLVVKSIIRQFDLPKKKKNIRQRR